MRKQRPGLSGLARGIAIALILSTIQTRAEPPTAGAEARTDALLATPNAATPVPPSNLFATTPHLEQQVLRPARPEPAERGVKPATGEPR